MGIINNGVFFLQWSACTLIRVDTPGIVSIDQWRSFWISYDNNTGRLQVGRQGELSFMETNESEPIDVQYLGYATYDNPGYFRFCFRRKLIYQM